MQSATALKPITRLLTSKRWIHYNLKRSQANTPAPPTPTSEIGLPIDAPPPFHLRPSASPSRTPTPAATPSTVTSRPRRIIKSLHDLPPTFGRNQLLPVPPETLTTLTHILSTFKSPIRYAIAYGSAVFTQSGYTASDKPMLDFIFAVSHPSHWHAVNMSKNPRHYSLLMRMLGSNSVAWFQESVGAGVWFNIGVEIEARTIKYGVISIDALCRDLLDWETLYVAGRAHKPVRILIDDTRVRLAAQANLASAIRTSLLLLPEEFTEQSLYETIASLSYRGDFRMSIGENPHKVSNIVSAQLPLFRALYGGLLKSFWKSLYVIGEEPIGEEGGTVRLMRQDISKEQRAQLASKFPKTLKGKVRAYYERKWNLKKALGVPGAELGGVVGGMAEIEIWERIVMDREFNVMLEKSLAEIVAGTTFTQSLKGLLSAGPVKSLQYVLPKLQKRWGSSQVEKKLATKVGEEKEKGS